VKSGQRIEDPEDRADAETVYDWHCTVLTAPIPRGSLAVLWIMIGFALIGVGLSVAAGRWGMIVFFLFFAALQLALIVGRGQQERRAWNRLERAALANGWVRPAERG